MSIRRLLLSAVYTGLLVVVALFFVNCHAVKSHQNCDHYSSSCGDIHNISYPFRLKGDPENCGSKSYELTCENNRPVLHLFSGNFYVLAIDYDNYRIRLVDVGIQKGNCSSLPLYYLSDYNFSSNSAYVFQYIWGGMYARALVATVYCENPVKSLLYMDNNTAANCLKKEVSTSFTSPRRHYSYVLFGKVPAWDVPDLCTIDNIVTTTLWLDAAHGYDESDQRAGNFSYLYFHNMLAYGFELSWVSLLCEECRGQGANCYPNRDMNNVYCYKYCDWRLKLSFRCVVTMIAYEYIFPGLRIIGLILAARTFCGMLCLFAFLIYMFRRRHLSMFDTIEGFLQSQNNLMPIRYSYSNIKKMTKGLKDKLGEGGYGSVYKGKLRSGNAVAIKILGKSKANGQDFINEVATIGRIHHVNVVQLIGFCAERSKRALVYDFMPNGSLEKYIFSQQEGSTSLSCKQMFEISLGVARGIEYLHRGCDMQILHFDIKPHNILLDENFTPKVSDFGLAKLYPTENSIVSLTAARGTIGYMAPELFYKNIGPISYKADVYSFGMLLMEMAGRRRNLNVYADHASQIYFPSWVYDQFKEGRDAEMGEATEEERQMVKKMIITALWCIQMKPSDRPSMNKVVEMLEGNIELLVMPPKPFLTPQEMPAAAEDQ